MKKIIISAAFALAAAISLQAQDINPTVSVTTTYKSKASDAAKKTVTMTVPDSLQRFNYNFDYSVLEPQYKGGADFTPYNIRIRPSSAREDCKIFYFRAGLGYLFAPEASLLFSPKLGSRCLFTVSDDFNSFFGAGASGYRALSLIDDADNTRIGRNPGVKFGGYDFTNALNADFRADFNKATLKFHVSDDILAVSDTIGRRFMNGVNTRLSVTSKNKSDRYFFYDVALDARVARDHMNGHTDYLLNGLVDEIVWGTDITAGPVFNPDSRVLVNMKLDGVSYDNMFRSSATHLALSGRYEFGSERLHLSLGAGFGSIIKPEGSYDAAKVMLYPYPDVKASFSIVPDAMVVYANLTGGEYLNTYSSLAQANHHFDMSYAYRSGVEVPLLQASREKVKFAFGFKGQVRSSFNYNVSASMDYLGSMPVTVVSQVGPSAYSNGGLDASIAYCDYNLFHTDLELSYVNQAVSLTGNFRYQQDNLDQTYTFSNPAFTSSFTGMYNWYNKIHGGLSFELATARKGAVLSADGTSFISAKVPGWFDLGLYADYSFNKWLTAWLKCSNLLGQPIQRNILYSDPGCRVSLGVCIKL